MRYIDLSRLRTEGDWPAKAAAAKAEVTAGKDPDDYSGVWRALKDPLAELFNDKCWFCEVSVVRSDNAVDHFRPKKRVKGTPQEHTGYRWLAFDQSNFRYACTFCNSRRVDGTAGGKADNFPLLDETKRVYQEGPTDGERPTLLDPCAIGDWRLLGCMQENGRPCATSVHAQERARAEASITIYHLHHEPTCKRRHGVAVQLIQDIDEAKSLFIASQTDADQEPSFLKAMQRILKAIHPDSEFSGEMHFLLRGHRGTEHPWVEKLLET